MKMSNLSSNKVVGWEKKENERMKRKKRNEDRDRALNEQIRNFKMKKTNLLDKR